MIWFAWYVFGGWIICTPLLLYGIYKLQKYLTIKDLFLSFVGGVIPFLREYMIFELFGVFDRVIFGKKDV